MSNEKLSNDEIIRESEIEMLRLRIEYLLQEGESLKEKLEVAIRAIADYQRYTAILTQRIQTMQEAKDMRKHNERFPFFPKG